MRQDTYGIQQDLQALQRELAAVRRDLQELEHTYRRDQAEQAWESSCREMNWWLGKMLLLMAGFGISVSLFVSELLAWRHHPLRHPVRVQEVHKASSRLCFHPQKESS